MHQRIPRLRHTTCAAAVVCATVATLPPTAVAETKRCSSADLRYPFQPGGPNAFGVFKLRIAGGSCATAHRVAKAWMTKYEASIDAGRDDLPKTAAGFRFVQTPVRAAQTYGLRGRKGAKTIRFHYVIPNG